MQWIQYAVNAVDPRPYSQSNSFLLLTTSCTSCILYTVYIIIIIIPSVLLVGAEVVGEAVIGGSVVAVGSGAR